MRVEPSLSPTGPYLFTIPVPVQARRYLRSLLQHMANGGKYDRSAQWCKIWIEIDRPHDPHLEVGMYVVTLSTTTPSILTVLTKSCADGPVEGHQINMSFTELEDGTLIPVFYPNESSQGVCFLDALQALIDEGYRLETLVSIGGQINPKENKVSVALGEGRGRGVVAYSTSSGKW